MTGGMNVITSLRRPAATAATLALLACAIAGVSSCGSGGAAAGFDAATVKKLRLAVEKVVSRTGAPGAVAGVWTPGGSWSYATGIADSATGRKMVTSDMVAIGGSTMTFVATVVLQLVEEKRLRLDEPLGKYNTQVPAAQSITIRQLLNHTSGIFDYREDPGFLDTVARHPGKEWPPERLVEIAARHPLEFSPGMDWRMSGTNYILLGMIVEKATGNSLGNEINSRIADRLDLKNTYLCALSMVEGPEGERVHGYMTCRGTGRKRDVTGTNPSCYWAAGGMASDLEDMGRYLKALATGELLSSGTQARRLEWMETGKTVSYLSASYGLGLSKVGAFVGHSGGVRGYDSSAYYHPGKKAAFFACVNLYPTRNGTADQLLQDIAGVLYPEEFP